MNTTFLLMAEFSTGDIPLNNIASKYLNLSEKEAGERAKKQTLPFPVFRAGSQKAQWLVHVTDLAAWIDAERSKATQDWRSIQMATGT